ncbi:sensor histidine kinase [Sinisalibacter lacisalsi]|uniref:histidine kinase n=1 Tax=Sinisalibacter lacisalsi TaxID=1526570 RepID=A0ABQ1QFW0_9RHOB|nr:HAMP domain-containing sensor histidine kinase [Sinisalibacter lacisalsi]GGD24797.1 ATPase [Sinisalibacter lacisalsi]
MINSLSGRFLILTIAFVMVAEVLIFVPSVARFREDYLRTRLERAQIASLVLLADDMIDQGLEQELLQNAEVFNVVLLRDEARELMLSSPVPGPAVATFDLRDPGAIVLIRDAMSRLVSPDDEVIRVIGDPVRAGGLVIEVTMASGPLRAAMLDYGWRIFQLSLVISVITAGLLFLAVRVLFVRPVRKVVGAMASYAQAPEDARRVLTPSSRLRELREAEEALHDLETQLSLALKQKDRLAQLGGAVARISHDLRNILTTTQLFADRVEMSNDPMVQRALPKLIGSINRAVNLTESTLAFGRAEEPAPRLTLIAVADVVNDVVESERMATGDHDISYAEDVPKGLTLRADPEQLYRILRNLVRNARQAIEATGEAGEIMVAAKEEAQEWIITVTDTGPGLPKKARELLFQPFAAGGRKGGTGLGLAIAAELARGHGGRLELLRTGEDGTVFAICLPRGFGLGEAE